MGFKQFFVILPVGIILIIGSAFSAGHSGVIVRNHLPSDEAQGVVMKTPQNSQYLPNKVIIRLKDGRTGLGKRTAATASLESFLGRYAPSSVEGVFPAMAIQGPKHHDMSKFLVMTYAVPVDPFAVAKEVAKHPDVLYAEPWFIYKISGNETCTPNDPLRSQQWALTRIMADSAFCVQHGDTNVVIAIVDNGVQWDHPDLAANIWTNPGETGLDNQGHDKRFNGIDDDSDGLVDDWHGWDFVGAHYSNWVGDNNPSPTNSGISSHGTHVAGIAGAVTNNNIGIAGVSNNCRIMAVKVASDDFGASIPAGFEGIVYAAAMGAQIINLSWGAPGGFSDFEQEVIDSATSWGSLVVASAGNEGNSIYPNYPAGYNHVMDVGATDNYDQFTTYSNFGLHIHIVAPGGGDLPYPSVQVLSTWFPNTDTTLVGTSMSAPHVSGVAALVKARYPLLTPDQLREQVRVTADDIYALNSDADKYQYGKGRVNAYNALTKQYPSLRMNYYRAVDSIDGNNNGALEPNETFAVLANFTNYLEPTSPGATITLTTTDSYVQITQPTYQIGTVPTMGTAANGSNPFIVHVKSNVPIGHVVQFVLIMSDGTYQDFQLLPLLMHPTFATQAINNIQVTFTNDGKIGFNDYGINSQGIGFIYQRENQLYEGGLIIGTSASNVVDCVREPTGGQDVDFTALSSLYTLSAGPIATQEGHTSFNDSHSATQIGLLVDQRTYAFTPAPDTNFVIVRYDLYNNTSSAISNVYAGLFMDWDIQPDFSTNKTGFDGSRNLGYAWNDSAVNSVYCGVRALDTIGSFRGLINPGQNDTFSIDLSKTAKWSWISGGIVPDARVGDVHAVVSEGPLTIPAGARKRIGFALVAGNDFSDLRRNADFARTKWTYINSIDGVAPGSSPVHPASYALGQNYPNPFNPTTTITYDLADAGAVSLVLYNVLGQEVRRFEYKEQAAGRYTVELNASSLPSGMYVYRLTVTGKEGASRFTNAKKLLLVR